MPVAAARSREEWLQVIKEFEGSGLSAREFSADRGIHRKTLLWWRWRLKSWKAAASAPTPTTFVPVTVEAWTETPVQEVEAVLPSGVVLRFGYTLDRAGLADLAAAFGGG